MIIGITGTIGAGKGTVANYLTKKKKFKHFSVRKYLSDELKRRKKPITRDTLVNLGNELRTKHGPSFLAEELYLKARKYKGDSVLESIRSVGEVASLKSKSDFYLLAVDANTKNRYERTQKRNSSTDDLTFAEFVRNDKREAKSKDPHLQNLSACTALADYKIENNDTINDLEKQMTTILTDIKNKNTKYVRPSWDDYFFEVMNAISKRATCDRGRAGSIAVLNNQILVTGYVGSPVGLPHCDEVGHELKKALHDDGTVTQHCVRTVHSEQNLICQAAKRGVSIEGATIYTRMTPCRVCAMLLINCGIKKIYCERKYHTGAESEQIFKKAKIKLVYKYNELQQYKNM